MVGSRKVMPAAAETIDKKTAQTTGLLNSFRTTFQSGVPSLMGSPIFDTGKIIIMNDMAKRLDAEKR